jgi:hypothetical protein
LPSEMQESHKVEIGVEGTGYASETSS